MAIQLKHLEDNPPWITLTDLIAAFFTILVLCFVIIASLKTQKDTAFTRKEAEYQALKKEKEAQEQKLSKLQERNRKLASVLAAPIEKGVVAITDGKIDIQESILFPSGASQVKGEATGILRQVARALMIDLDTNEMIMVAGFTDNVPIANSTQFKSNWELSTARATNIVGSLIVSGVPGDRIFASGFGEYQPKVPNINEKNRSMNRRVEILRVPSIRNKFAVVSRS